jgi:hypothetical protein
MKDWKIIGAVLLAAILVREVCNAAGVRPLLRDELALTILVFPAIIYDFRQIWGVTRFWAILGVFLMIHVASMWIIFDAVLHLVNGVGILPMLLVGVGEAYIVAYELALLRYNKNP